MKKRKRPAGKKAGKSRRRSIMRHSREGARPRKGRPKKKAAKRATKKTAKKKVVRRRKPSSARARRRRGVAGASVEALSGGRGLGAEAGGQSGDTEGLTRFEEADSESVEELIEEGQAFEAGIVGGVEEAGSEVHEVRVREVPEDDVPQEYVDED